MSGMLKEPKIETFQYGPWEFTTVKSHIMTTDEENALAAKMELPHLPDMLFNKNTVQIKHDNGFGIQFSPVDALQLVNAHEDLIHVSTAKEWMEARQDSPHANKIVHPYDWTFSTAYQGTLLGEKENVLQASPTQEKINYEKLKIKEKILFYDEVELFEDELDDNGCSHLSVKLRIMPSGFFVLQRFYLRVDNTLIRVYDTRLYFEAEKNYLIREYSEREDKTTDISVSAALWTNQNEIVNHLTVRKEVNEKLAFPL
jgi:type 2A phosphatase activator TIP41